MQEIVKWFTSGAWLNAWIITAFLIVFATGIVQILVNRALLRLLPALEKTKTIWDDSLLSAAQRPLNFLIWLIGLSFASELISANIKNQFFAEHISQFRQIGVIVLFVWFVTRFITAAESAVLDPERGYKQLDAGTVHIVSQLLRVAAIITAVLIGLQTFNYKISGLLAAGGVSTLMISFAAKDWLSNFFGGLSVYLDRPFGVGDWIRSPDKNIEGIVEHIGLRTTRIRTFDKRPLYVPNGVFSTIAVENPSRMSNRRIYTRIGLRYDDAKKIAKVVSDIKAMLQNHPDIDKKMLLLVNLVEFGPSSLNIMVYTFTKTTVWAEYQDIQQDVFLKILDIIEQNDAQCAFPTTTIDMPTELQLPEPLLRGENLDYQHNQA